MTYRSYFVPRPPSARITPHSTSTTDYKFILDNACPSTSKVTTTTPTKDFNKSSSSYSTTLSNDFTHNITHKNPSFFRETSNQNIIINSSHGTGFKPSKSHNMSMQLFKSKTDVSTLNGQLQESNYNINNNDLEFKGTRSMFNIQYKQPETILKKWLGNNQSIADASKNRFPSKQQYQQQQQYEPLSESLPSQNPVNSNNNADFQQSHQRFCSPTTKLQNNPNSELIHNRSTQAESSKTFFYQPQSKTSVQLHQEHSNQQENQHNRQHHTSHSYSKQVTDAPFNSKYLRTNGERKVFSQDKHSLYSSKLLFNSHI